MRIALGLFALLISISAGAMDLPAGLAMSYTTFDEINLDPNLALPPVETGTVTLSRDEVTITLFGRDRSGAFEVVFSERLPVVNVVQRCNMHEIVAQKDDRKIMISDYRGSRCKSNTPHMTMVYFTTPTAVSVFGGKALQPALE